MERLTFVDVQRPSLKASARARLKGSRPVDLDLLDPLMGADTDEEWRPRAACKNMNPDMFFAERGEDVEPALRVCDSCPVRYECLAEHLYEEFGVWGGTTEAGRRRLRRGRTKQRTPKPMEHGRAWTYNRNGCRCDSCLQAYMVYKRERKEAASF